MRQNKSLYIEVIGHVSFWVIPSFLSIRFNMMTLGQELSNEYAYMPFIANVLFNALLVYSNIFVLFPAYRTGKLTSPSYILTMAGIVFISAGIKSGINYLFCWYYFSTLFSKLTFRELYITEFVIAAFFLIQSVLYCTVKDWVKNSIVNRKLIEEKLTLELKYLKAQVNPHFLFNTLNNLYSVALRNNDSETATGLTKLSGIMRYMLDDLNENEISLDKEINYLKNYIDLQKLRFSEKDDIKINFDIQTDTPQTYIPPYLFIVFVENAFKYGIDFRKHSFIDIKFKITGNTFRFNIRNSIHYKNEGQENSLGLKNIKERLELLYGDDHKLEIINDNNTFNVDLNIKLAARV
jgi:two-component system LytT family sensor kinase